MLVRGIRGATTVSNNDEAEILEATLELLQRIVQENQLDPEMICSLFITVTNDLDAAFPAKVIRDMPGWERVPLMCSLEIPVPGSLPHCIRFMVLVNTEKAQKDIVHVYLNDAERLRPDLAK